MHRQLVATAVLCTIATTHRWQPCKLCYGFDFRDCDVLQIQMVERQYVDLQYETVGLALNNRLRILPPAHA